MTPWTAPEGDGEGAIAALIAATGAGMALMLWTQRPPAGDPAVDAACLLATVVAVVAAGAGGVGLVRRRRRGRPARPTPSA